MTTEKLVREKLETVIDPELGIDIVNLGLIYRVNVLPSGNIDILMTLTSPGCPLAGVFGSMVKDSLRDIEDLDVDKNVSVELTFDPPWTPEMMSEESKAELGF
jgi:metal-sulfur cluster biosynthetic enzyme